MLMGFEEAERSQLQAAIAAVGLAKGTVVVPAIERLREWKPWLEWAGQLPTVALQEKVSAALDALPRGREPSPPGERFRRTVLAASGKPKPVSGLAHRPEGPATRSLWTGLFAHAGKRWKRTVMPVHRNRFCPRGQNGSRR